ncbi:unnamed protein product [Darwinula stevensoni]|uniref:Uncharacterized protein n=1 Tax=Darwinula stevensoni TaxID=69355 RepID=A0A7R9A0E7_9CRUS|nr:unnamed protein product [Darwinula stevensoni]CAG0880937.1 unnamed protein product [Darwinula stevensoni]
MGCCYTRNDYVVEGNAQLCPCCVQRSKENEKAEGKVDISWSGTLTVKDLVYNHSGLRPFSRPSSSLYTSVIQSLTRDSLYPHVRVSEKGVKVHRLSSGFTSSVLSFMSEESNAVLPSARLPLLMPSLTLSKL